MPFAEDTKSVKLKEKSAFNIKGNLPTIDGATAYILSMPPLLKQFFRKKNILWMKEK
jgi:hypothetical protein